MKKFEVTISRRDSSKDFSVISHDKAESDDLLQLLSQITFILLGIQSRMYKEELLKLRMENDDIPF